jgi:NADH-quinone oxidoreductase subunit M
VIALSLFAIVYASLIALAQTDLGKLLAYSTVAHMGIVTLGLFLFNRIGVEGAIVQLVSYGFVAGAMLLCVSVLVDRTKQREIAAYGGVAGVMPRFATFSMLFAMANIGLPGTSGFVGEFMVIMGAIRMNFWIGAIAALTLILSASYTLWMVKRVIFGKVASPRIAKLADLGRREVVLFASLALIVLMVGVDPKPFRRDRPDGRAADRRREPFEAACRRRRRAGTTRLHGRRARLTGGRRAQRPPRQTNAMVARTSSGAALVAPASGTRPAA